MKTLNYFKYLLLIVFSASLMFSCSDDETNSDDLKSTSDNIELRNGEDWDGTDDGDFDPDCFVKLCLKITDFNPNPIFDDVTTITVPGIGTWEIKNNIVTLPNGGGTTNVVNGEYCFAIPITGAANVLVQFHGYGGIALFGAWTGDSDYCELYSVEWPGTFKAPINAQEELELTCDSQCDPPPTCFVETCITFIEGDASDNYTLDLPTQGSVTIANGMVTIATNTTNSTFPLPADGTICLPLPVFDPVTAVVTYNGTGSVSIVGTWEDGTVCTLFSEGQCSNDFVHAIEEVEISCDPPCPKPLCEVEACITFIAGDASDNYQIILPTTGTVTIANGIVTIATITNNCVFPLPADGTLCLPIPIFAPTTATVIYNGTGSVEISATYEDGTNCTIFSAGVNSELDLHIQEDVLLSCEAECPEIPDCYVNVCLDLENPDADLFKVQVPGVGSIIFQNGQVITPNGNFPFPGGQFCIDLPVFNGGSMAKFSFTGPGSAVVTFTYPDLLECVVFEAGLDTDQSITKKMDVFLTCEGECAPLPETCTLKVCAQFKAVSKFDFYKVLLPGGGEVTIQGGIVTLPNGDTEPYNGSEFCAEVEIEVGSSEEANLQFSGTGSVVTTVFYPDGTGCVVFKAGIKNSNGISASKDVKLSCNPPC